MIEQITNYNGIKGFKTNVNVNIHTVNALNLLQIMSSFVLFSSLLQKELFLKAPSVIDSQI